MRTDLLAGIKPARALAALVLAEIERGSAEGAHIAYDAMMLFESPQAGRVHAGRVAAALRAPHPGAALRPPAAREPLWKALAVMVAHTGRHDTRALVAAIRQLAAPGNGGADDALARLRAALDQVGVRFLAVEDDRVQFELHGHAHKPISLKRFGDLLAEIRQARLA